jgi:molecular chaperone GrpE
MAERDPFAASAGKPADGTTAVPSAATPNEGHDDSTRGQQQREDAAAAYAKATQGGSTEVAGANGAGSANDGSPHGFGELAGSDDPDDGTQVAQDLDELASKAQKADEYLALAQRTQADFENYRKRAAREASLAQDRGIAKLAKELLPAIDNLDRAVQAVSGSEDGGQIVDGLKLVQAEVMAALARVGIEPFSPAGEPFDPQLHEAVAQTQVPGVAPGTVVEVYQQGFRLGESVLRPARVLVAA